MSRIRILSTLCAAAAMGGMLQPAAAGPPLHHPAPSFEAPLGPHPRYTSQPFVPVGTPPFRPRHFHGGTVPNYTPYPFPTAAPGSPGYPVLDAPMNPVPVPNVPVQVGSTMITNQALYPHEMLYPHRYRALYPPFYYTMHGRWKVTPWGVRSHEHWQLRGTEVKVKYHSSISPFALFHPPSIR